MNLADRFEKGSILAKEKGSDKGCESQTVMTYALPSGAGKAGQLLAQIPA
ncbi:hypothetical protein ACMAY7_16590 [Rhodobacteraceae bacterium nBUS_24]